MVAPVALTVQRTKGDTYPEEFILRDASQTPIDVTGFTFVLTVDTREEPDDATTNQFQLTGVLEDAPNGRISFQPSQPNADLLDPGTYFYDIQQTDGASNIRTISKGQYIILPQITQ